MSWYKIQSSIFRFIGDIKWHGLLHPFWFQINATGYHIRGEQCREIEKIVKVGDVLLRRFEGYIDKWFIPGYWNHGGIYVGNNQMVHAISEGVLKEDILNFTRTDHICILRPRMSSSRRQKAAKLANKIVGFPYDFGFDFKDFNRFSCTEVVSYCYRQLAKPKRSILSFGKSVIVADDFFNSDKVKIIWDSHSKK